MSLAEILAWRDRSGMFESLGAFHMELPGTLAKTLELSRSTSTRMRRPLSPEFVAGEFFETLGVSTRLGRTFHGDRTGVILQNEYWTRVFHADSASSDRASVRIVRRANSLDGPFWASASGVCFLVQDCRLLPPGRSARGSGASRPGTLLGGGRPASPRRLAEPGAKPCRRLLRASRPGLPAPSRGGGSG